jgi:hypothetical protein
MVRAPTIPEDGTAAQACALLDGAGWRQVGAGDWSWVFADPSDELAARVTPFDPGYRMFAQACLTGPPNRWLPRMIDVLPLIRDGYVVLMERLWPADEPAASAFCAALGIPNVTGYEPPTPGPEVAADEPDIVALRIRIRGLLAEGQARYLLWAGSDIREGNVMVDGAGQLKLVDPVGVGGWKIFDALRGGRADLLTDFSRSQLEDFLTIPYFGPGREGLADSDELRGWITRLYGEAP